MIEHLFDSEQPAGRTQHRGVPWRQKAVGTNFRSLAAVLTRIVAMVIIASLLILVLLPAALAVQAARGV